MIMQATVILLVAFFLCGGHCLNKRQRIKALETTVETLARQVMQQQLFVEETIRSSGSSGIKQIRINRGGTRPYLSESHTLNAIASIHDHANLDRTLGMGEFIGVLNGVEFRTRHNDYRADMPSRTSNKYHAKQAIPFPSVPPSVLNKNTVEEQIMEMREYFRAWKEQDSTIRNYNNYFRPILSYLEGAWTTETTNLSEPFKSDRHHLDAKSWLDLQDKIRFTSMTGLKDLNENYAFLPTTITDVTNGTVRLAQWNYRIMSHPIERRIWLDRLKVADDLSLRVPRFQTLEELATKKSARFRINGPNRRYDDESTYSWGEIDKIMYEIPGKNNYNSTIIEDTFDQLAYRDKSNEVLNGARYNRVFKIYKKGAMGLNRRHRGFADRNLFVAKNTQPQVAAFSATTCKTLNEEEVCKTFEDKLSYAIPLELYWFTPLLTWNPFDIEFKKWPLSKTVYENGRNGGLDNETAWNGTDRKHYYHTPAEFFEGPEIETDPADTVKGVAGVLDRNGQFRRVVASGNRIMTPNIPGVGSLRLRYPLMPIFGESMSVWKELDALKDIVLNPRKYNRILYEPSPNTGSGDESTVYLLVGESRHENIPPHSHQLLVKRGDLNTVTGNTTLIAESTLSIGHQHAIEINKVNDTYHIMICDGNEECFDKHPPELTEQ